ncbi:MAG: hypothetical protein JKY94_10435 [Rhodobacteraceae bacterium]|nr:hypothetical protein [Paracoccaceae bacterium]
MEHPLNIRPAKMVVDGQVWVPEAYALALADKLRIKQRSTASHNHQFAEIQDLWANLPADHAQAPYAKSADAFRKHGLIERGFCDVDTLAFETHDEAIKHAPFIAKLARKAHGYALTVVRGPLVVCSAPHSQSFKAMGKDKFHASKQAVLDWGHMILGVDA